MNLNDLTIGQAKELASLFNTVPNQFPAQPQDGLNCMVGEKVIIRTYSAGNWFGTLEQKAGNEVILKNARRMWRWWAAESISLSAVAIHGLNNEKSKIIEPVPSIWLDAIEIIPCSDLAIKSLEEAPHVKAS